MYRRPVIAVEITREPPAAELEAEPDHYALAMSALEAGNLDDFMDVLKRMTEKAKSVAKKGKDMLVKGKDAAVKKIHKMTAPKDTAVQQFNQMTRSEEHEDPDEAQYQASPSLENKLSELLQMFTALHATVDGMEELLTQLNNFLVLKGLVSNIVRHTQNVPAAGPREIPTAVPETEGIPYPAGQFVQVRLPIQPYWPTGC